MLSVLPYLQFKEKHDIINQNSFYNAMMSTLQLSIFVVVRFYHLFILKLLDTHKASIQNKR